MEYLKTFSDEVRECFQSPKNLGAIGNADGCGEVGNILCGDTVKFYVKADPSFQTIESAKYQTYGCVYSVACSEMLAKTLNGMAIEDAKKLTGDDVIAKLKKVPFDKRHCAVMSVNAWRAALNDAIEKRGGERVELDGKGLREIKPGDDRKTIFSISKEIQLKHRIAELFDEWFIPELERKKARIALDDVDVKNHIIYIESDCPLSRVIGFIQETLKKYFEESFTVELTSK